MAHGSVRQMRAYAEKVFGKDARLSRMSDGRTAPTVPLGAVLSTWQWGFVRRTPSTEQIGDLLMDARWRERLGLKPEDGGSSDSASRILDSLSIEEWNEMMLEDFFTARRAGILTDEGQYGNRCAAVDLNELFKSEKIHCDLAQLRHKAVVEGKGQYISVLELAHLQNDVTRPLAPIPFVIGWEV